MQAKKITDRFVKRPGVEFYDLTKDPSELNNLANDSVHQKRIRAYTQKLHACMKQEGDKGADIDIIYDKKPAPSTAQ